MDGDASEELAGEQPEDGPADGLSEEEREVLAFEKRWWRQPGAKEQAITDTLGMTLTRYYRVLGGLIDKPEALAAEPALVKRLLQTRNERHRLR